VATRAVRSSTSRAIASTGTVTPSGLSTTTTSMPRRALASHWYADRGEIERGDDDLGPLAVVERFGHGAHRDRDARRQGDLGGSGTDYGGVATAQLTQRRPPHIVPGGCAAALPDVEKFGYLAAGAVAQWGERAGVEVDPLPEDGEFLP